MGFQARRAGWASLLAVTLVIVAAAPRVAESAPALESWPEIEAQLAGQSGTFGLALQDLGTGEIVLVNADDSFPAASTYKVLVMYRVFEELERGRLAEGDLIPITAADAVEGDAGDDLVPGKVVTVAEALEAMIAWSSNTAAHALARRVGGWSTIDAAARKLGMGGFGWGGDYYWTTPRDMCIFFRQLAAGQLVSASASQRMIRLLERQQFNDRIPALLPAEAIAAHKTGELPSVRNDVGIVYGPNGGYVFCAFSRSPDVDSASSTIARLSQLAYDRYAR